MSISFNISRYKYHKKWTLTGKKKQVSDFCWSGLLFFYIARFQTLTCWNDDNRR